MSRLRVVLADDHRLFREGLEALLDNDDIEVVAAVADGWAALEAVERHRPDIALLDVEMPGPGPAELIRGIRERFPRVLPVVLTMHGTPALVDQLTAAGAAGFIAKNIGWRTLTTALLELPGAGEPLALIPLTPRPDAAAVAALTPRETEVLALVARSRSNQQIAAELYLSEATVKRHLTTVYRKLGASGRVEALAVARRVGILDDFSL